MFDRASKKLGLEQAVLGTFEQGNDDDKPTSKEMEQLLKKGAYALLEDENDEEGKAFCADDIENILAKRTRTRVIEGAKTASWYVGWAPSYVFEFAGFLHVVFSPGLINRAWL